MGKTLDPETLPSPINSDVEAKELKKTSRGLYKGTFRGTSAEPIKEHVEAEDIIRALSQKDESRAIIELLKQVAWQLTVIALFTLLIVLLFGMGAITLPSAFVFAVLNPLLSGVLTLLGLLVRHLTK